LERGSGIAAAHWDLEDAGDGRRITRLGITPNAKNGDPDRDESAVVAGAQIRTGALAVGL